MTSPNTFLLGALLAVVASAQFPRLPKINSGHIAGVVKNAGKEVKQTLSQTNTNQLASEVAKGAKDLQSQAPGVATHVGSVANSAAQAASAAAQTAEAAKAIVGNAQASVGDAKVEQQAVANADPTSLSAATPALVASEDEVGHEIVHTDKLVEAVQGQMNSSRVQKVLKDVPKSLPEATDMALDPQNIKKAKDGVQEVHNIVQANKQQVQDLASKMIPGLKPSKVMSGVSKVVDGAAKHVEPVTPIVHEVLKSDPKNVVHAAANGVNHISKIDPQSVKKYINGDDPKDDEEASNVEEAAEWVGSHWQWPMFIIVGAVGATVFGWQAMKRRDSRSPTLLADNDMAGWMGGGPTRTSRQNQASEEPLFRQF